VGEHIYVSVDFLWSLLFMVWIGNDCGLDFESGWFLFPSFFFGGNWDEIDGQRLGARRTGVNGLAKYVYIYRFYALLYSSCENEATDD
jgi:hypothetical protein